MPGDETTRWRRCLAPRKSSCAVAPRSFERLDAVANREIVRTIRRLSGSPQLSVSRERIVSLGDTRLDRTVAIKVLPEHFSFDPASRQRFERARYTSPIPPAPSAAVIS
jgi:hypothetical protein